MLIKKEKASVLMHDTLVARVDIYIRTGVKHECRVALEQPSLKLPKNFATRCAALCLAMAKWESEGNVLSITGYDHLLGSA
jgi:hypothetical protein